MNNKMELIDNLINLTNQIDIKNININQIQSNINKLSDIYTKLKVIWDKIDMNQIKYKIYSKVDLKYNKINSLLANSFLAENENVKNVIINSKYIHCLKYSNIEFYWISNVELIDISNQDYILALEMMKITICLNKYRYSKSINHSPDKIKRIIIWVPINKERNFIHNKITQTNLKKTEDNFEAFVASGVTFGNDPRITIVTRYEEVEKLLIHELIHNYHLDGSNYHNELESIIKEYRLVKNTNNYDYEYSIYESYTELLSTYFYLIFKNLSNGIDELEIEQKLLGQIIVELLYSYNLICNLVTLNGYITYDNFKDKIVFEGNICGYEYYFIKGLMYNNFEIMIGENIEDFINIYKKIIIMIEKIKLSDDILLNEIYLYQKKQLNFKYQIH
jgi:hypothetical protein